MAKRTEDLDSQLREFESNMGRPNLGNFPDALDPHAAAPPTAHAETPDPAPDAADEPDGLTSGGDAPTDAPDSGAEPVQTRRPSGDDRMAELESRLTQQARELEFFRAGQSRPIQPAPAAAPIDPIGMIDQYLGGMRVTPEDVQVLMTDPVRGAEYLMNGIRAAVAAGAAIATNQLRSEYRQEQAMVQGATQLRDEFYATHPDLQPFATLVQQKAGEVRDQYPSVDRPTLIREAAARTRAQLQEWGVTPKKAQAARGTQRIRPAAGEMGGGQTSSGPGRKLTPVEAQLRDFERQTSRFYQS